MASNRQKFGFVKRGAAAVLTVALVSGMAPTMAIAQPADDAAASGIEVKAAQEKTPDGWAMEMGKEYQVPVAYDSNLNSYMDAATPATVVWDGEKYEVTVKKQDANQSPLKFIIEDGKYAGTYTQDDATKTVTFPMESLTSDAFNLKINFGLVFNVNASITFNTSELPTEFEGGEQGGDEGLDHTALEDGTYSVEVSAKNASNIISDSMMDGALVNPATITVKDGTYTLDMGLQGVEYGGFIGYACLIKHYQSCEPAEDNYNHYVGTGSPLLVETYDTWKDDSDNEIPGGIRYQLSQAEIESGYSMINMKVNVGMSSASDAVIAIDWDTLEAADEPAPEPGDQVKTDEGFYVKVGEEYSLPISLMNASKPSEESMAAGYLEDNVTAVYDGSAWTVSIKTLPNAVMGGSNVLSWMSINGDKQEGVSDESGNKTFTFSNISKLADVTSLSFKVSMMPGEDGIAANASIDTSKLPTEEQQPGDQVNTDALEKAIADAEAIQKGDKTQEAYDALQKAVAAAQSALDAAESQSAVDAAVETLNAAVKAFNESPADRPDAQTVSVSYFVKDSGNAFSGMLPAQVQAVESDEGGYDVTIPVPKSTIEMVNGTFWMKDAEGAAVEPAKAEDGTWSYTLHAGSIAGAMELSFGYTVSMGGHEVSNTHNMIVRFFDCEAINGALAAAKEVKDDGSEAYKIFAAEYEKAKAVVKGPAATQTQLEEAAEALNAAIDAFEESQKPAPSVDYTALSAAIQKAEAIEQGKKTDAAFAALQAAIAKAQGALGDKDAAQADVDAAVSALEEAVKAFNASEDAKPSTDPGNQGNGDGTTSGQGNGGQAGGASDQQAGALAKTGDAAPVAALGAAGVAAGAAAAVAWARRRSQNG